MRIQILLFLFFLTNSVTYSQSYYKLLGDTSYGYPGSVKKCHTGGYILSNTSYLSGYSTWMGSVCRLDSELNVLWHRYLPDGQHSPFVEQASNGDFYIISTNYITTGNEISRTDQAGNILWRKVYTNANPLLTNPIVSTAIDNQDNLYLFFESNQAHRGLFAKFDSSGNGLWYHGFCTDLNGGDNFSMARMGYDSSLYILGTDINWLLISHPILVKSDLNGNINWVIQLPKDYQDFTCMPNGDILIVNTQYGGSALPGDPMKIIRIDSSGHIRSTINVSTHNYFIYESSLVTINESQFQVIGNIYSVPAGTIQGMPCKLTLDTAGHITNTVFYRDSTLQFVNFIFGLNQCVDLSAFSRDIDGIRYQAVIYDPDTSSTCISLPFSVDSVYLDNSTIIDTLSSVILPTTHNILPTSGTTILRNLSQDGCLVNQISDLKTNSDRPSIFPIPFDNQVNISIPTSDEFEFQIFDITSKLIYNNMVRSQVELNTTNYPPGIYLYVLKNSQNYFTGKIIK